MPEHATTETRQAMWTRDEALRGLDGQVSACLARQQTTPGRFDTGAYVRPDWGADDPGGTTSMVALALWRHLLRPSEADAEALPRVRLALDYLQRAQRPSGLTDLRDCNYDSSPDAGFILQNLCPVLLLARESPPRDAGWREAAGRLEAFARRMAGGMRDGGFHTPNHRWVIAGALALAGRLFPDLGAEPVIDAYLAEGIDLDADGFYIERSAGVYDAICARSLLHVAESGERYGYLRDAVARNLRSNLYLLNADGTIETGLSRRQDNGTVPPASGLAIPYLWASLLVPEEAERFRAAAAFLWQLTPPDRRDGFALSQLLHKYGEPIMGAVEPLPDSVARHFPAVKLWRARRGVRTASVFGDAGPRLLNFRYGQAYLAAVSVHQSYFGVGQFLVDDMAVGEEGVRLVSRGERNPYRPGYDQPLGRPVPPPDFVATRADRDRRRLPPAHAELEVRETADGLALRLRTLGGIERATAQIAFDFAPGGTWETGDTGLRPEPGQTLFLKGGFGTMWYGSDAVRIGPGADAHRMWQMRDAAPPAPGLVRVLLTFETPLDHEFTVTGGTWPWPIP